MSDLLAGMAALDAAAPDYIKARNYYDGLVDEVMSATGSLTRRLAQAGARYRINFAKTPVDVVANRLEVAAVTVPDDKAATQLLQTDVWDANEMLLETPDVTRQACMFGDGYLFVWDGDQDGTVDVFFNSPISTRLFYDPENPRRKTYAIKRWKVREAAGVERWRVNLYYRDRVERWISTPGTDGLSEYDWVEHRDDPGDAWPTPNPHGAVPFFHLRTASPYGVPVHKDAYGAQDGINKLMVTMLAAVDSAGFPARYFLLEADAILSGEAGEDIPWDDDADAPAATATRDRAVTSRPGEVAMVSGAKSAGQFDAADPKHFLDPLDFLVRAMAQTSTTPLHYFDPSGDVPSGESLRTADAPLVKRVRYLQMRFAAAYAEALSFALAVLGRKGIKVDVRWSPANSTDDSDSWAVAQAKLDAGVPARQVLLEQGYTADQVDGWLAAAGGDDNLAQIAPVLVEVAKALQGLGAAKALGVVDDAQVAQLVDRFVPPGRDELVPV